MASLTGAPTPARMHDPDADLTCIITNSETVYVGGYYGMSGGYATEWADTPGMRPLGLLTAMGAGCANAGGALPLAVTGNTSATVPPRAAFAVTGFRAEALPVAGATSADVGRKVYLTSDNLTDLTLTPTLHAPAVGVIVAYRSATSYDVRFFGQAEQIVLGSPRERWQVGSLSGKVLEAVTSANVVSYPAPKRARILSDAWRPASYEAGIATGTPTLSLRTGGGAVSGGVLTVSGGRLNAAADLYQYVTGTAVTNTGGNAIVDAGEVITYVRGGGAGLTALASGNVIIDLYLDVEVL